MFVGILAMLIVINFFYVIVAPRKFGKTMRIIFNKIMEGWNDVHTTKG